MYNPQKLSVLAKQMLTAKTEQRIKGLAMQEYRTVELISDKITEIAQNLRLEGLLNHAQAEQLKGFRKHVYFLHFALDDIINNRSGRTMDEKVAYLHKMLASYTEKLHHLEQVLGEDIKHVKTAFNRLKYSMADIKDLE